MTTVRLPAGVVLRCEVVGHRPIGLDVSVPTSAGAVRGLIDRGSLDDERPLPQPDEYPPVGRHLQAVVMGHTSDGELHLSARRSDVEHALSHGLVGDFGLARWDIVTAEVVRHQRYGIDVRVRTDVGHIFGVVDFMAVTDARPFGPEDYPPVGTRVEAVVFDHQGSTPRDQLRLLTRRSDIEDSGRRLPAGVVVVGEVVGADQHGCTVRVATAAGDVVGIVDRSRLSDEQPTAGLPVGSRFEMVVDGYAGYELHLSARRSDVERAEQRRAVRDDGLVPWMLVTAEVVSAPTEPGSHFDVRVPAETGDVFVAGLWVATEDRPVEWTSDDPVPGTRLKAAVVGRTPLGEPRLSTRRADVERARARLRVGLPLTGEVVRHLERGVQVRVPAPGGQLVGVAEIARGADPRSTGRADPPVGTRLDVVVAGYTSDGELHLNAVGSEPERASATLPDEDRLAPGTVTSVEVVRHQEWGLDVRIPTPAGAAFGLVDAIFVSDGPFRQPDDYPPVGTWVEAVVQGYPLDGRVRLSARTSDVERARARPPAGRPKRARTEARPVAPGLRLPAGVVVAAEVVAHRQRGLDVKVPTGAGDVVGVIESSRVADERPSGEPDAYPPRGSRVEAVVEGYPLGGALRLSSRRSDVKRAKARRTDDEVTVLPTLVRVEVVTRHRWGLDVRTLTEDAAVFGVVDVSCLADDRILRWPDDYPPVGSRLEAALVGYGPSGRPRVSIRRSDVERARQHLPDGVVVMGEVVAHGQRGLEVKVPTAGGDVVGMVDASRIADVSAPNDWPPDGARIEVVVAGYTTANELHLSARPSDVDRAKAQGPVRAVRLAQNALVTVQVVGAKPWGLDVRVPTDSGDVFGVVTTAFVTDDGPLAKPEATSPGTHLEAVVLGYHPVDRLRLSTRASDVRRARHRLGGPAGHPPS